MENQKKDSQIQSNLLLFCLFLFFMYRKDIDKLSLQKIDLDDLDRKSELLEKMRGYMDPQEQYIIHSAEIILQIISKMKTLVDLPRTETSEARYSAPGLEDKRRRMLVDLSEFLDDEKKMLIHQMVDFDAKFKVLEKELKELQKSSRDRGSAVDINDYIRTLEPIFADEAGKELAEFKKLASILKIINNLKNKEKMDESDIMGIIQPLVGGGQKDSLS